MSGHSEIKDVYWADAEVESVLVDYDSVVLSITETATAKRRQVRCLGYIGYQLVGFWDEFVVESARVVREHEFLSRCMASLERRHVRGLPRSGQEERNALSWSVLIVTLSDGAELLVAAHSFCVE